MFNRRTLVATGVCNYCVTAIIVAAGVSFGVDFLSRQHHPQANERGLANAFGSWDGVWYADIARNGYSYDSQQRSSVAFFPAFPLSARVVSKLTGLSEERALVFVANVCLVVFFVLAAAYVWERYSNEPRELADWTLLAFGLWPVSFFTRMAYSESMFLLAVVVVLYGFQRKWSILLLSAIVGLATAIRPLGVALIPPLYLYMVHQRRDWPQFMVSSLAVAPISCWGIMVYMLYQYAAFGDAFAFMKTQELWGYNPGDSWSRRVGESLILQPIWSKYDPSSPSWWARHEPIPNPLFSLEFANPIYFVLTVALVAYGAWRRELNSLEVLLASGLLLIPYFSHGHRAMMLGQARYALAAFPVFLVWGRILYQLPAPVSASLLGISAFFLGVYSALFAAWYRFF